MDVSLSRPAVRVGALGPPDIVAAIQNVLGLAIPGSFPVDDRLFVLQPATEESPSDVLLLVVSAEEGVTEEVREQLRLAPAPAVVFLDGCDRVPEGQGFVLDLIELELRGLAGDGLAIIRGSSQQALAEDPAADLATWGPPIRSLVAALAARAPQPLQMPFRMPIGDLVPTRRGTVVLGRIADGRVQTGDEVAVDGSGRPRTARVRGVLRAGDLVPEGRAGEDVGLFLEKIRLTDFLGARALARPAAEPVPDRAVDRMASGEATGTFVVPVFYATDRNRTEELTPRLVYGAGRGALTFGVAEVSLPRSRRRGDLPAPAWWRLEHDEHLANHVVLLDVALREREPFVAELRRTLGRAAEPEALVFVHGYNVTFEDAVRRTALLANDLDLPGVPVLYSWPSAGKAHRYTVDEMNVEWTLPHFEELLRLVLAESGARTVHVVAHGMGSRAVVRALGAPGAGHQEGGASLRQVVFAAPDIDRDTFLGLAPRLAGRAERFTLYGSSRDHALRASRIVHSRPRAGEPGAAMAAAAGIDSIDASAAEAGLPGSSGVEPAILNDLASLLRHGLPPDRRSGLSKRPNGRSWVLQP